MSFFNNLTEMANNMIVRLAPTDDTTNESPEINTSLLPSNQPQSSLRINTSGIRRRKIQPGEKRKGRHLKKFASFVELPIIPAIYPDIWLNSVQSGNKKVPLSVN